MDYNDFCNHYDSAMKSAKERFGDAARGQSVISNGMDADCEAHILSDDYINAEAEEIIAAATAATEAAESDFSAV